MSTIRKFLREQDLLRRELETYGIKGMPNGSCISGVFYYKPDEPILNFLHVSELDYRICQENFPLDRDLVSTANVFPFSLKLKEASQEFTPQELKRGDGPYTEAKKRLRRCGIPLEF